MARSSARSSASQQKDSAGKGATGKPSTRLPERYKEWATALQREAIDAVNAAGGNRAAAARTLGIERKTLCDRLDAVLRKAARAGYSPEHDLTHETAPGFHVGFVTTQYGPGGVERQWVRQAKDREERLELLRESVQSLCEPFRGQAPKTKAPNPRTLDKDRLAVIPMGDPHIGMLAWAVETGADFDLAIAEQNMVTAVDRLVELAPPCEEAWLIELGDFFHTDNGSNRTNASGHVLDVDSRYGKMCQVGLRGMRRCTESMLSKFGKVRLTFELGNHDDYSAIWLALAFAMFYENEPRVTVDASPTWAHKYRFGQCLIAAHHGHGPRHTALDSIMATDWPEDWGATLFRHWYLGHVHHESVKELRGCTVETVGTLAGKDAWATKEGYRAKRDMRLDVWHRTRGRILRHMVGVEEVEAIVKAAGAA
jgi:hypothetical protein